jgi:hypothetical protein
MGAEKINPAQRLTFKFKVKASGKPKNFKLSLGGKNLRTGAKRKSKIPPAKGQEAKVATRIAAMATKSLVRNSRKWPKKLS